MKIWRLSPLAVLVVAGCSSAPPPPLRNFPPLDYSYLPPLVLKVATLNVVNAYIPSPDAAALIGEDPAPPTTVLATMLSHRLVPSGAPGIGSITIQNAGISQVGGNFVGVMTVDINLAGPGGTGFAEASVTASETAPDQDATQNQVQGALYDLTKQLMDDMNVQLQYQIQHNLSSWLSWTGPGAAPMAAGIAPATGAIEATPLTAPEPASQPAPLTSQAPPGAPPSPPPGGSYVNPAVPGYLPGAGPSGLTSQQP